mgnify:FL=1
MDIQGNSILDAAMRAPSFQGVLEVKHSIAGRMRVRIPSMKSNRAIAERIVKTLSGVGGIRKISANPMLGTVLVEYDAKTLSPVIVVSALTYCFDFEAQVKSRKSLLASELTTIGYAFNQALMQRTKGLFDLRALMTILLILQLLKTVPILRRTFKIQTTTPSFPTNLLWWLFQSVNICK